jgi:predicted small secreted protein
MTIRHLAALLVPALLLAGCNTTRGIGQDVKSVGKAIEKSVD